jgi:pyruvate-ferredoxin/flavodoxin oxidoreductase
MGLKEKKNPMDKFSAKGSQFEQPLLEFSGACAGCGETAYMKLLTQLYGDRMIIANATGCTQAWGFSIPSYPYATNSRGHGPAISNSLFENNAEYSLGMVLSVQAQRLALRTKAEAYLEKGRNKNLKAALEAWLAGYEDDEHARELADNVLTALAKSRDTGDAVTYMKENSEHFVRKSMWMYGGDGWAYDIGYGGLDHVLASGIDVNILVVDTEVYSNTGGQASKATPIGAVAQFAAAGKRTVKKDLGLLAAEYGDVYVASIALGANPNQAIKAIKEAVAHKGPSLIIAYAPCINHGIVKGMGYSTEEAKLAVNSGYWFLYRYSPELRAAGKNPFVLDSKEPTVPLEDFLNGEVRYASLRRTFPADADVLMEKAKAFSAERYEKYKKLAEG